MDSIKKLNQRIRGELHLKEFNEFEDELPEDEVELTDDELQDQEEEATVRDSKARIRLETETRIRGLIRNVEFDIQFRDLADRINDQIDGVVLTRDKAHQLFNIVRELMGF
jgi:hypothetical protein